MIHPVATLPHPIKDMMQRSFSLVTSARTVMPLRTHHQSCIVGLRLCSSQSLGSRGKKRKRPLMSTSFSVLHDHHDYMWMMKCLNNEFDILRTPSRRCFFFKRCSMQCNRLTRKPFFGLRYSEDRTSFQVSDVQVFTNNMQLTGMGAWGPHQNSIYALFVSRVCRLKMLPGK